MNKTVFRHALSGLLLICLPGSAAYATFHLIDVNEVYTNADGTVQYVELISRGPLQTNLGPTRIVARNADGTASTLVVNFSAAFTGSLNNGDTLLIATPGFQAVAGFAPDFVMPADSLISFPAGRIAFQDDAGTSTVDSVAYGLYTGANTGFGLPALDLPCDGNQSLHRVSTAFPRNNATEYDVGAPTPRRNNGTTTTLNPPLGADCDASLSPDACDIASDDLSDDNNNDIPDECEARGDFDGDGDVDFDDYRRLYDCLDGPDGGILPGCDGQDLTGDEAVDLPDVARFQNSFGTSPP